MSAGVLNITVEQGSTFIKTIQIKDSLDAPVNISDVTQVRGQVRKTYKCVDSFPFVLSVTDAVNGLISWRMEASISATIPVKAQEDWVYDVELVRTNDVERILQGTATISPEVTK